MSLPVDLTQLIEGSRLTTSFVVDKFGSPTNEFGSSAGLGNQTDRVLLRALRASAEVVLTSGRTARLDEYRMPKTADLAIFTNSGVDELQLVPTGFQRLHIIGRDQADNFPAAIYYLGMLGYQRIHVEFGPTGFREIAHLLDAIFLSSCFEMGVESFAMENDLTPRARFQLDGLTVWVC